MKGSRRTGGPVAFETELEMVERHVLEGEERIAGQHRVIARLEALGADTTLALQLLDSLCSIQQGHLSHWDRIRTLPV